MRERLAERGVEIAEQARERTILRHVDSHLVIVPQAFADMHVQDFANGKAALRTHLQRCVVAALYSRWRLGDARDVDLLTWQQGKFRDVDLADVGRKIDGALVHLRADRLVDKVDDERAAVADMR